MTLWPLMRGCTEKLPETTWSSKKISWTHREVVGGRKNEMATHEISATVKSIRYEKSTNLKRPREALSNIRNCYIVEKKLPFAHTQP